MYVYLSLYIYIYIYIYIYVCVCVYIYTYLCLFNGISTFLGYIMPNPSFEKNSRGTI